MKPFLRHIGLFIVMIGLLAGCRTATIYNVNEATVVSSTGNPLSLDQVRNAIVAAGTGLGWQMAPTETGHIQGTLNIRSHSAIVDISYSTESYNITYKSSSNLKYDPDDKSIHSNYNGWIQKLDSAIKARLATL